MLPTELAELVQEVIHHKCERQNIELKRAGKGTPEKLYDTLSSFPIRAAAELFCLA